MKNILYINSTVRKDSRTDELAKHLLSKLHGNVTEIRLEDEPIEPLNGELLEERDRILASNDFTNNKLKYARQFASAYIIVISAPFWDLSFPAKLKTYIENISVVGVTFKYSEDGRSIGLCKANDMYFVSTAGGKFLPNFGYDYVKTLGKELFGIKNAELFYAEELDIDESKTSEIMNKAKQNITSRIKRQMESDDAR